VKGLELQLEPKWVEPAFTLYYPDMVYSNPLIAEVDLLLMFEGGYACVELKREAPDAPRDSLKYFVNGLAQQPVFYAHPEFKGDFGGMQYPTPFLTSLSKLLSKLVGEDPCCVNSMVEERRKLFSLDNFLRLLLIYGSPNACKGILDHDFLSRLANEFQLVRTRFLQIHKVKLLRREDDIARPAQIASKDNVTQQVTKVIVMTPILNNEILRQRVAEAVCDYVLKISAKSVIFVCTTRSRGDAKELTDKVKPEVESKIQAEVGMEVVEERQGEGVEKAWADKALKLCEDSCTTCVMLFVGEVPKGVLVKVAEALESEKSKIKLAVMTWMPHLNLEKLMHDLREGDVREAEKVGLGVVDL